MLNDYTPDERESIWKYAAENGLQENKQQTSSEECFPPWCNIEKPLQRTVVILLQDNLSPILKT